MYREGKIDELLPQIELPQPAHAGDDASAYQSSATLAEAVNVAIILGQPLLVTGEPGCGKTQLAASIAWQLKLEPHYRFDTKSTSTARDLFYTFDALSRFYDAQVQQSLKESERVVHPPEKYIHVQPLGRAILQANPSSEAARRLDSSLEGKPPKRSVVLIDEIDKAPRDFPNDLLNEIETMSFRIHELDELEASAPRALRPIVVITSNSEKNLPEPFLRRCVYHHIDFPDDKLEEILRGHFTDLTNAPAWLPGALNVFRHLRLEVSGLEKKPATAELLGWIVALRQLGVDPAVSLGQQLGLVDKTIGVLIKTENDKKRVGDLVRSCLIG